MALNFLPRPMEGSFRSPSMERGRGVDVVDLLPDDPFGMNVRANVNPTLSAAIAGLIEDLKEYEIQRGFQGHCRCLGDLGHYWVNPFLFNTDGFSSDNSSYVDLVSQLPYVDMYGSIPGRSVGALGSHWLDESNSHPAGQWCVVDAHLDDVTSNCDGGVSQSDDFVWVSKSAEESFDADSWSVVELVNDEGSSGRGVSEPFPDGLLFALPYMGVRELLAAEMSCKTLYSAVRKDPSLWRCIHISEPLNERLTDEALLQLTRRAEGTLHCLNLADCRQITNDGLKQVLETNGRITTLNIQGCGRLSADGLLDSFKHIKTPGHLQIKHLMIGGIFAMAEEHYEDLISLLDLDVSQQSKGRKPRFYHNRPPPPSCDYDCALDVELCPKCQGLRLLYDCPAESCQAKTSEPCRACSICIPRCYFCGRCVADDEYEETFYLDYICSTCKANRQDSHVPDASLVKLMPLPPPQSVFSAEQTVEHPVVD